MATKPIPGSTSIMSSSSLGSQASTGSYPNLAPSQFQQSYPSQGIPLNKGINLIILA
ncbi:hypothetical protein Pyn_40131 [Prunus yedoensis var. nudiflora]|uniref:Uncharacterized protein n=1 Tax=Prunus yedoensis var. nudiflora TaxID=2094558 RepID=A0A314US13_PRUYE|nr:hypothetical protein Pyn_40131 [Prunus yedoensis var. nudiflora]